MMTFYSKGSGPALVFIHGFPFNHELWSEVIAGLEESYTVITIDLPGISSVELTKEISMSSMARELYAYLLNQNHDQCVIFGHSMGGYLAVEFLSQFPEMVAGMSFVHSFASGDDEEKLAHRDKVLSFLAKGENEKMPFIKTMVSNLFPDEKKQLHQKAIDKILNDCARIPVKNISALYQSIKERRDHIKTIQDTAVPIQWVIGSHDTATPISLTIPQVYLSPVNSVHIIQNCGHMSMIEYPTVLKSLILDFCKLVN